MRMLFTFAGGSGHLEPLVPIARAAEAAGHTVAFAGRPLMVPQVEALGFAAFAAGSDVGLTPKRLPLEPADLERDMRAVGDGFGRRIARERAADILPLCASWRPDLLVCEEMDFGSMVVAERLALPRATVLVSATGAFVRTDDVAEPLNEVRAEHGLPPDPDLAMLSRYLVLAPFPRSLRDPACPMPATAHTLRLATRDAGQDDAAPSWVAHLGTRPTIYFTLGTIYNMESGDLFNRVIAGLRDLPANLIVTVGRDIDPRELGRQPANVHVERYIPHAVLLPQCHLVVSHGGSGSVVDALAHGLPMVLLPMGADQPLNAARCETLGVALVLDAVGTTPREVREAVSRVLADSTYRQTAERIRDEIDRLPGPRHAVTLLERLAFQRRECPVDEIVIRVAVPDDAASIATIHEAAVYGERGRGDYDASQIDAWAHAQTPAALRERIGSRRFFIAESPSEPVAYAQLDVDAAIVRSIYVAPHYRRRGLGRRLGQAVFGAARDAGLPRLKLDSSLNAVPFYEALGFSRLGSIDHRLRSGVVIPCVRMTKQIDDESRAKADG